MDDIREAELNKRIAELERELTIAEAKDKIATEKLKYADHCFDEAKQALLKIVDLLDMSQNGIK